MTLLLTGPDLPLGISDFVGGVNPTKIPIVGWFQNPIEVIKSNS